MLDFKEYVLSEAYLTERFINLFSDKEKEEYKDEVYSALQQAYSAIGGIKGSGFENADDMVKNIPMWKLSRKDGKIVAGVLYKDKGGRKIVASFTDGTTEGKKQLADILKNEFTRSYTEVSEAALGFIKKVAGVDTITKFAIPREKVKEMLKLKDDEFSTEVPDGDRNVKALPTLKDFFYQRKIGGHFHTKIMLGNPTRIIRESNDIADSVIEFENIFDEMVDKMWDITI